MNQVPFSKEYNQNKITFYTRLIAENEAKKAKCRKTSLSTINGYNHAIKMLERKIKKLKAESSEMKITNGCKVKFDGDNEVYTVSQWDGKRGWAGDSNGAGWYFRASQVTVVKQASDLEYKS